MRTRGLLVAVIIGTSLGVTQADTQEQDFRSPPDTARLWVYWTQSGHNSLESVTADLEAMKRAGIGGVLRMDCSVGQVPGGSPFLGEQWRKQFVHSVHECERLGLEFTTITGPGWTGTGGPWISADQSMKHLVPATVTTKGPARFDQVLPLPQPRVSKYHRNQTPHMKKEISEFYKDVALFAFPRREPVIADIQEKALFIRNPFTSMPGVRPYLPSPADHPAATQRQVIDPQSIIDLTGKLQADGRLIWDVPPGEWTIVRLGARSTGANTRPAPSEGLGLESDKFSKQALATHFEAYFDPLLKEIGPRPMDRKTGYIALDADSWEMSSQNWTPTFRAEFKQRRGYDPWLYFATYTGCVVGSREQTERFLWDIRKTCQELLLENHAAELKEMCHQRGLRLMIEPYDMNPAGDLDLGSYADFPAGEFWYAHTFKSGWSCIAASSIAHTMGKPIVLAEGFTSIGNWARSPWTLKNQTDWAFAIGINKFAIHGFAHQADESAPGSTFGPYGVFWNRKQTFWPMVRAYHDYLARCSYLLQQGVTVSDILYLTPEGTPQVFQPPASAMHDAAGRLPDKNGYSFDGCSPRILMDRAAVRDGRICFPGGTSYRLLVLPRWKTMTPALLAKIIWLVESGATVLGSPPISSPSLSDYPQCDARVKQLAEKLWGKAPCTQERVLGEGCVLLDSAAPQLAQEDIAEDVPLLPGTGKWIWYAQGNPTISAPAGDVHFRYCLDIGDKSRLEKAVVEATADNSFTLQANGNQMLAGDNFHKIYLADITSTLKSGQNEITVTANNFGPDANPAGLITAIRLAFVDGTTQVIGTDANWSASRDKTNWSAAKELGDASMAPWHLGAGNTQTQVANDLYPDYTTTSAVLAGQGVPEDFQAEAPLRYTHRRTEDRDIYFVSNRSDQPHQADCTFRVAGGQPELWNPVNGERRPLPQYQTENGRTVIPMRFEPRESYFVVFPRGDSWKKGTGPICAKHPPGRSAWKKGTGPICAKHPPGRSGKLKKGTGPICAKHPPGRSGKLDLSPFSRVNFPKATSVAVLQGSWEVSFDPKWGGPEKVTFDALQDWTGRKEEGIKHYSGIANYRRSFDRPAGLPTDSKIYLDLGTVHEIARVKLNGKDLGVVWCAPWRIDISTAVKPGKNELEIEVANLWPNRLIGDAALPPEKRFTKTSVRPYRKDSPLLESGLLGPVTLQKVTP